MKTRVEKYYNNSGDHLERTTKNVELYEKLSNTVSPTSKVDLLDNVSEINVNQIKDMINRREDYQRVRKYQYLLEEKEEEKDLEYDIYEDIENKIYDINNILETAKRDRGSVEKSEESKKLKNTQYNILSRLNLSGKDNVDNSEDVEGMVTDFFAESKEMTGLNEIIKSKQSSDEKSLDFFKEFQPTNHTVVTEPVTNCDIKIDEIKAEINASPKDEIFYTGTQSFTQQDFEGFQNLQGAVKVNNKLIKILIAVLITMLLILTVLFVLDAVNVLYYLKYIK